MGYLWRLFLVLTCAVSLSGQQNDDSWANLKKITYSRWYTVIVRRDRCLTVQLAEADERRLKTKGGKELLRGDVVWVSLGPGVDSPIYSGRSSWQDVISIAKVFGYRPFEQRHRNAEYLRIMTTTGQLLNSRFPSIENERIVENKPSGGTDFSVPKASVRKAEYVRFTPATSWEYLEEEENFSIMAPRLWFHDLLLPKIRVLLYDATVPESNFRLSCP